MNTYLGLKSINNLQKCNNNEDIKTQLDIVKTRM